MSSLADGLESIPAIAIVRDREGTALATARRLVGAGLRVVEITTNSPGWQEAVQDLSSEKGICVGVGTVLTLEHVRMSADLGASFVVSPGVSTAVVCAALEQGLEVIPGVTSATEVILALSAGATWIKLFPAGALGTAYLNSLREPFDDVCWVPTGGVSLESAPEWFAAGAKAIGLGSRIATMPADEVSARVAELGRAYGGARRDH